MIPIKKVEPLQPGFISATLNSFEGIDPGQFDWAGEFGQMKVQLKDINGRLHDIILKYPDQYSAHTEQDLSSEAYKDALRFSQKIFRYLSDVFGLTDEEYNRWASNLTMEQLVMPTEVATALNTFIEELSVDGRTVNEGKLLLHYNNKGVILPYTWDVNRYRKGEANYTDNNGGLFTVSNRGTNTYINRAFVEGEISEIVGVDGDPVTIKDLTVYPCEPIECWTAAGFSRNYNPFITGTITELQTAEFFDWKHNPCTMVYAVQSYESGDTLYMYKGYNGSDPTA